MNRPPPYHSPNVRKLFLPDRGKLIFDMDLVGADATVAAKECGGAYWQAIQSGRKINVEILAHSYPATYAKWRASGLDVDREPQYTKCKNMHYGTLYVGGPAGIGAAASIPVGLVGEMQPWFFSLFPEVKGWHERVNYRITTTGSISNAFGFRVIYFDRPEQLSLPESVNWICQSTVAVVCQRGSLIVRREFPEVDLLLQVHDSLVGQVDIGLAKVVLPRLLARLNAIPVPYTKRGDDGRLEPDPLFIKWSVKASTHSWGECGDYPLPFLKAA